MLSKESSVQLYFWVTVLLYYCSAAPIDLGRSPAEDQDFDWMNWLTDKDGLVESFVAKAAEKTETKPVGTLLLSQNEDTASFNLADVGRLVGGIVGAVSGKQEMPMPINYKDLGIPDDIAATIQKSFGKVFDQSTMEDLSFVAKTIEEEGAQGMLKMLNDPNIRDRMLEKLKGKVTPQDLKTIQQTSAKAIQGFFKGSLAK